MNNIFFCDYINSFSFFLEEERQGEAHANSMAYSSAAPIPLYKEQGQQKIYPERSSSGQERRPPPQSNKKGFQAFERRDTPGRGAGRPNSKPSGMNDPYDLDIAPLNVFENQVIPVGIHNLSKSFRPNMATIRVLSLGTNSFQNGGILISNILSKNLGISTEECKTACFSRRLHRERIVWTTNFI